jgi:hypothetical protein
MRFNVKTTSYALLLITGVAALGVSLSTGVPSVSASSARTGKLHATKACPQYDGTAGSYCTIKYSSIPEIKYDSTVTYNQAAGIPAGMLDSNVVLDAGNGDRALGRCTVDLQTYLGLCTFSDGTGQFAGFSARVNVSFDTRDGLFHWDGTYQFSQEVQNRN